MTIESGENDNKTVNEYKFKDEAGKPHSEKIEVDTDTGKVQSHTLDGKQVEKDKVEKLYYHQGNGEIFILKQMESMNSTLARIFDQMKEMNYYLCKGYGDESDKARVEKLING